MSATVHYPLSAVVAADELKLALCLAAVDPAIGGVLIEGPRGMAKSTLARGVAELLPAGEFVTLPLGASEERIVGSLDLDAALGEGRARFSPGVLAKADGGVLYVDEVNLLPDHLVDLLLDVAASGVNLVERDGISHRHPARFVLIGTMNPEEGELRPQLLDRFGLNVRLDTQPPPAERAEIIRRRLAFDADPQAFVERWEGQQDTLRRRCAEARRQLARIPLDDAALDSIARRCFEAAVDGLRADLVWLRAARAHAAWRGGERIEAEDIDAVEHFALLHRRRQSSPPPSAANPPPPPAALPRSRSAPATAKGSGANCRLGRWPWGPPASCRAGQKALSIRPRSVMGADARSRPGALRGGLGGALSQGAEGAIQWLPTLLRGRPRQRRDLLRQPRSRRPGELWLVIVDASASTRRYGALAQAKGLLATLFEEAYRQRVRLAVLHATGQQAQWLWQGQKASRELQDWLRQLGAGGGTPLLDALHQAAGWLARRQRQKPAEHQRLLVLTDGRLRDWPALPEAACPSLLIDLESGPLRLGKAERLARELGAEYRHISELNEV
ncbi:magnesium chelatase, subunit ChlI family protein [Pseudomonas aeruginosa]|nr:magnesium chelatase, subunit ChlI family protein [Pseudomonas aeruginosa]